MTIDPQSSRDVPAEEAEVGVAGARRTSLGVRVFLIVTVLVIVFGVVIADRFGGDPTLIDSPVIGTRVQAVSVPLLESDGEVALDGFAGDIVVVNFWASWCLPCRSEHPALVETAAEFASANVTFIGVLSQDTRRGGIAFLDELGRGEGYIYAWDERSRAALSFGTLGLPETFFIDREGTIVAKVSGPIDRNLLVGTLNDLLLGREVGEIRTGDVQNRDS